MEKSLPKVEVKKGNQTSRYVARAFIWGMIAKILDAVIKLFTVPLLLHHYGKADFGLIALSLSVNAYLQLLDMGINTGAIKFFSQWIREKKLALIDSVARTSITFYTIVGTINALVLILVAKFGAHYFDVDQAELGTLREMFYVLAFFAIFNWATSVFNQLLIANEKISYIQQINIARSLSTFFLILITLQLNISLTNYFLIFTLINSISFIPFYILSRRDGLISSFSPRLDWINFSVIFKYSIAIIAMGIFQMTANKSRPIILSIFSGKGIEVISDYRVLETITIFVISLGGMFSSIFLPKSSKLILDGDQKKIQDFAYNSTLYTSVICVILCVPFMLCAKEVISIYVGPDYVHLSNWLILWMFTILSFLHSTPVNSLILAKGRTRALVYCTALSCVVSIIVNAVLSPRLGVGSAVLGHTIYIAIQMSFYYLYFNNKVLGLHSWVVFKSFFIPAILGLISGFVIYSLPMHIESMILACFVKSGLFLALYSFVLVAFRILNIGEALKQFKK